MAVNIQLRRGTAAEWTAANPTLAVGEIGIETDTDKFKIGNGADDWATRPYGGLQGPDGVANATSPITYDSGTQTVGIDEASISITASQLSDITATAAELNTLDGITATVTELNHVDGVTSAIQTQLDAKSNIAATVDFKNANYTITDNDFGKVLECDGTFTITVPDGLTYGGGTGQGARIDILNRGTGVITFAASGTATINSKDGALTIATQYSAASLVRNDQTDTYYLIGDIA